MVMRQWIALAVYAAIIASLFTPLYDALPNEGAEALVLLLPATAASAAVGAGIARGWALVVPLAAVAAIAVDWAAAEVDPTSWPLLFVAALVLLACTGGGIALGRAADPGPGPLSAVLFAIALVPAGWAVVETIRRGPPAPAAVQDQLPLDISLGNLCPGAGTSPGQEANIRRRADALITAVRARPYDQVTIRESDNDQRTITIRRLAREQLDQLEGCDVELEDRLLAAIG